MSGVLVVVVRNDVVRSREEGGEERFFEQRAREADAAEFAVGLSVLYVEDDVTVGSIGANVLENELGAKLRIPRALAASGASSWTRLVRGGKVWSLEEDEAALLGSGGKEGMVGVVGGLRALLKAHGRVDRSSGGLGVMEIRDMEEFARRGGGRKVEGQRKGRAAKKGSGGGGRGGKGQVVLVVSSKTYPEGSYRALGAGKEVARSVAGENRVSVGVVDVENMGGSGTSVGGVFPHWRLVVAGSGAVGEGEDGGGEGSQHGGLKGGEVVLPGRKLKRASRALLEGRGGVEEVLWSVNDAFHTHLVLEGKQSVLAGRSKLMDELTTGWFWLPEESLANELVHIKEAVQKFPASDRSLAKTYIQAMEMAIASAKPHEYLEEERDRVKAALIRAGDSTLAKPLRRRLNVLEAITSDDRRRQLRQWEEHDARRKQRAIEEAREDDGVADAGVMDMEKEGSEKDEGVGEKRGRGRGEEL